MACDSPTPECAVPTNLQAIELRFDRFLLPGGGLGAGLRLFTGGRGISLIPRYDVVERVVVFRLGELLQPNVLYTAEVVPGATPSKGFWAFDEAPLEPGPVPLRFSFTTGSGPRAVTPPEAVDDSCSTLAQGALSRCVLCHGDPVPEPATGRLQYPPMWLDLTPWGFTHTAIGHIAHESETGSTALGSGLRAPARFGVDMNIVDPGFPANSYLVYKLLRKRENVTADPPEECLTPYHSPVSDDACGFSVDEAARLREWFARGDPMPKETAADQAAGATSHIARQQLDQVVKWIANGAPCEAQ